MTGIVRRFVARVSGLARARAPEGGLASRVLGSPFLARRVAEAEDALRGVVIPGYDVDVVSSGVVTRIRVSLDGSKVAVFIDYYGRNPGCSFCRFISDTVWDKVFKSIVSRLEERGFGEVYILEAYTGALLYPPPGD